MLRKSRNKLQAELAEELGYEQTYVSALEVGSKGPPTADFVERLIRVLDLSTDEQTELHAVVEASRHKLVLEDNAPQEAYWLLKDLRDRLPMMSPAELSVIRAVVGLRAQPEHANAQGRYGDPHRTEEAKM